MFLNKIVDELNAGFTAAEILNKMRIEVKNLLRQYSNEIMVKDGMDMALAVIDFTAMKIQFAGAHNPLILIRNEKGQPSKEIEEYKGDNMPIGIYIKEKETFTNYVIDINKGDLMYLFSDGYYDQFGGEFGKKIKKDTFKQILLDNAHLPMAEQKAKLEAKLANWQGDFDQIDDITVIGLRI